MASSKTVNANFVWALSKLYTLSLDKCYLHSSGNVRTTCVEQILCPKSPSVLCTSSLMLSKHGHCTAWSIQIVYFQNIDLMFGMKILMKIHLFVYSIFVYNGNLLGNLKGIWNGEHLPS